MSENPYRTPPSVSMEESTSLASKNRSLRRIVTILLVALVFQWVCHLLTAIAMFGYMGYAKTDPVAEVVDTIGYGCVCVGMTATSALVTAWLSIRAIRRHRIDLKDVAPPAT